jgi:hypothetical protein
VNEAAQNRNNNDRAGTVPVDPQEYPSGLGAKSKEAQFGQAKAEAQEICQHDEARNQMRWCQKELDLNQANISHCVPPPHALADELEDLGPLFNLVANVEDVLPAGGVPNINDDSNMGSDDGTEENDDDDGSSDTGEDGRATWFPFKHKWVSFFA